MRVTRHLLRYGLQCISAAEFFGEHKEVYMHFAEVFTTLDGGRWVGLVEDWGRMAVASVVACSAWPCLHIH